MIICESVCLDLYCERCTQGIFGWIFKTRTRKYFSTIRPRISKINVTLRARIVHASGALVTKLHSI